MLPFAIVVLCPCRFRISVSGQQWRDHNRARLTSGEPSINTSGDTPRVGNSAATDFTLVSTWEVSIGATSMKSFLSGSARALVAACSPWLICPNIGGSTAFRSCRSWLAGLGQRCTAAFYEGYGARFLSISQLASSGQTAHTQPSQRSMELGHGLIGTRCLRMRVGPKLNCQLGRHPNFFVRP